MSLLVASHIKRMFLSFSSLRKTRRRRPPENKRWSRSGTKVRGNAIRTRSSDVSFVFAGIDYINRENFLTELDNGVVLCHLAQIICNEARAAVEAGLVKGVSWGWVAFLGGFRFSVSATADDFREMFRKGDAPQLLLPRQHGELHQVLSLPGRPRESPLRKRRLR